tara:strand:+ start:40 stop:723 length:684 start_codon:yes stop_codon:yes gene_type:complete
MKKILLIIFIIPLFGFSQQLYWYDVFFEIQGGSANAVTTLVNDYYSNVERPSDLAISFSRIPLKGEGFTSTHMLSMFSPSSKSLADFRSSLKGEKWDLYTSGMRGKVKSIRAEAGNVLSHVNLDKVGPIGQAWHFKVHAKDTGKFVAAFTKLMKTFKPNGFVGTGQLTHGSSNGESMFIYATSSNLNEAFAGGPKNKKEADAMQTFFNEIDFAEFSGTNTRVEITQY